MTGRLLILGCTRDKLATTRPVPAIELYTGDSVPQVRDRLTPERLSRTLFFSGLHGLIPADTLLLPYDRRLRPSDTGVLSEASCSRLLAFACLRGVPEEVLVVAEADYQSLLEPVLTTWERTRITRIFDPCAWADIARVLHSWSWT
ncbi:MULTISPECIES: hypothetical protein [unclassified Nocardiopsis]|uniref:hypothetical protein n=1 Tax=unclassified Nocardiopsis TaxID=2649073 RepID=UPI00135B55CC|nr:MULTISPECIES: hypothetical protein [unclassified Nocardiopsis]